MSNATLQARMKRALEFYQCRPSHLAKASGVSQAVVHRIAKGQHENVMSSTLARLEPYLSLALPQNCLDGIGRKPKAKPNEFTLA